MKSGFQSKEDAVKFLANLLTLINAQDNRGTASPYYYTIEHDNEISTPVGEGDSSVWVDDDGEEVSEPTEEQKDDLDRRDFKTVQVHTGFFFTRRACQDHIDQNKHHYKNPHTYVGYCFRNPEMEQLLDAISIVSGVPLNKH